MSRGGKGILLLCICVEREERKMRPAVVKCWHEWSKVLKLILLSVLRETDYFVFCFIFLFIFFQQRQASEWKEVKVMEEI